MGGEVVDIERMAKNQNQIFSFFFFFFFFFGGGGGGVWVGLGKGRCWQEGGSNYIHM